MQEQVSQCAVRDLYTLGSAGGAGGVDDVGRVGRGYFGQGHRKVSPTPAARNSAKFPEAMVSCGALSSRIRPILSDG